MAGNTIGGQKARNTNYERYGRDFYKRIGAKGGRNSTTGGFAANPELAKIAGRKGGKKSQRGESHKEKLEENSQLIDDLLKAGASYRDISRAIEVPYGSTRNWIKKNLEIFDEVD